MCYSTGSERGICKLYSRPSTKCFHLPHTRFTLRSSKIEFRHRRFNRSIWTCRPGAENSLVTAALLHPIAASSFDELIGALQDRVRHREAECFRGSLADEEIEL